MQSLALFLSLSVCVGVCLYAAKQPCSLTLPLFNRPLTCKLFLRLACGLAGVVDLLRVL